MCRVVSLLINLPPTYSEIVGVGSPNAKHSTDIDVPSIIISNGLIVGGCKDSKRKKGKKRHGSNQS